MVKFRISKKMLEEFKNYKRDRNTLLAYYTQKRLENITDEYYKELAYSVYTMYNRGKLRYVKGVMKKDE